MYNDYTKSGFLWTGDESEPILVMIVPQMLVRNYPTSSVTLILKINNTKTYQQNTSKQANKHKNIQR
jgi:hypothetical protein